MASGSRFSADGQGDQNVAFGNAVQHNDHSDHRNITGEESYRQLYAFSFLTFYFILKIVHKVNILGMSSTLSLIKALNKQDSNPYELRSMSLSHYFERNCLWSVLTRIQEVNKINRLKRQPNWSLVDRYRQHIELVHEMTPGAESWTLTSIDYLKVQISTSRIFLLHGNYKL